LVKKVKRKIPKNAIEPLMQTCELLSREWKKTPAEIFKWFLSLMNKYADYFFSQPWPKKYDYKQATTFTDEDINFLFESEEEFPDRYMTVCLKKNINMEHGFMGYFGIFYTQQAFHEQFERPHYVPVLEKFKKLIEETKDAKSILKILREEFSPKRIHDSLIDLLEHEYPDEATRKTINEMFELLHTVEGLKPCRESRCSWYERQRENE